MSGHVIPASDRELPPGGRTGQRRWSALTVLLSGTFLSNVDVFIVVIALPAITRDLGTTPGEQQMVLAGYQLVYALGLITGGRLGDRYGVPAVFTTGMAAFVAGSVGCALAASPGALIATRLIQAAGAALLVPQAYTAARLLFSGRDQRRAFSLTGAVMGVGAVCGQVLGGVLVSADLWGLGWRSVFWFNVPVGVAALTVVPVIARPFADVRTRTGWDVPGLVLAALALAALSVPLAFGREAGWPWWCWVLLALSAPLTLAFLAQEGRAERRGAQPLLPRALLAGPFRSGLGLIALFNSGLNAFFLVLGLFFQEGLHWSPLATGAAIVPLAGTFALASLAAPRWSDAGHSRLLLAGGSITAAGCACGAWSAAADRGPLLLVSLAVVGGGQGLFITPALNTTLKSAPRKAVGAAAGVVSTVQQASAALGVCVLGGVYYGLVGAGTRISVAFAATAAAIALTAAGSTLLVAKYARTHRF